MKMNIDKYSELVQFRSITYSDVQDELILYIEEKLKKLNFTTEIDRYGNLIAERGKGNKPLIIAHVDINQFKEEVPTLVRIKDYLIGFHEGEQIGVGHDDKAGIYFALSFAENTSVPLCLMFTKDEEAGCVGTGYLNYEWDRINLAIQLDRRGAHDISSFTNGVDVVTPEFMKSCKPYLQEHGYKFTRTIYTDVGALKSEHDVNFCCVNVSCGYYNEHTDQEYLRISQFNNACLFASKLLINLGDKKQFHKAERPKLKPLTKFSKKGLERSTPFYDETFNHWYL